MTVVRRLDSLTRAQRKKLGRGDHGEVAEELVAEEYGLSHQPREESWYDVRAYDHDDRATKGEVKSTHRQIGQDYPAAGRFRVRRGQHRSLTVSDGQGTAWYIFVLLDEVDGRAILQRRRPSTVTKIVEDRGGWNHAGHEEFDWQHKLPIDTVIDV